MELPKPSGNLPELRVSTRVPTLRGVAILALHSAPLLSAHPAVAQRGGRDAVSVLARAEQSEVRPGDLISIAVALEHAQGYHTWPHHPVVPPELGGLRPIATSITISALPEGLTLEEIAWPDPVPVTVRYTGAPLSLLSYAGTVVARVRLRIAPDHPPGPTGLELRVRYQACDDLLCYRPQTVTRAVRFRVMTPRPPREHAGGHRLRTRKTRATSSDLDR